MATFNPAGHLAGPPSGQDQSEAMNPDHSGCKVDAVSRGCRCSSTLHPRPECTCNLSVPAVAPGPVHAGGAGRSAPAPSAAADAGTLDAAVDHEALADLLAHCELRASRTMQPRKSQWLQRAAAVRALAARAREAEELRATLEQVEYEVAEVYATITEGRFAKCNTAADYILDCVRELEERREAGAESARDALRTALLDLVVAVVDFWGPPASIRGHSEATPAQATLLAALNRANTAVLEGAR